MESARRHSNNHISRLDAVCTELAISIAPGAAPVRLRPNRSWSTIVLLRTTTSASTAANPVPVFLANVLLMISVTLPAPEKMASRSAGVANSP